MLSSADMTVTLTNYISIKLVTHVTLCHTKMQILFLSMKINLQQWLLMKCEDNAINQEKKLFEFH